MVTDDRTAPTPLQPVTEAGRAALAAQPAPQDANLHSRDIQPRRAIVGSVARALHRAVCSDLDPGSEFEGEPDRIRAEVFLREIAAAGLTVAPPEPPAPLDVERLAQALKSATRPFLYPGDKGYESWLRRTADAIAAEYDRLAALSGTPEPRE